MVHLSVVLLSITWGVSPSPIPPTTWLGSAPTGAHQLNQDLYSYDGSGYGANGINFHANRPILYLSAWKTRSFTADQYGADNYMGGTPGTQAFNIIDTAALFGLGSDYPGQYAQYIFTAQATAGAGTANTTGGFYITINYPAMQPVAGEPGAVGGELWYQAAGSAISSVYERGAVQRAGTAHGNTPFFMDIIYAGSSANAWSAGVLAADAGSTTALTYANDTGSQGVAVRTFWVWAAVTNNGSTVATLPAPGTAYTATSTVTSSGLNSNNGIQGVLNFLNNPPIVKLQGTAATSIANNTNVNVPFTGSSPYVDNYSGWSSPAYTVPITGLYLCHGLATFNDGTSAVFARSCGFKINGTANVGPAYASVNTDAQTGATATRVYDLQAGDTVNFYAHQTSGSAITLSTANRSRFFMTWLAGTGQSNLSWTPPDTSFRWTAGTPGSQLPTLFQEHLANDLNFLIYRPYFTGYQSTAQTGLANNSGFHTLTGITVGGIVHGTNGDPYNGWSASNNYWVAPVNGWYLVVGEFLVNSASTSESYVTAGVNVPSSGGFTPPSSNGYPPDSYQQINNNLNGVGGPFGATAAGLYYLLAGETVQPQVQTQLWGTWSTAVASGINSHFSVIWMCN
jgi:hypothetical protein